MELGEFARVVFDIRRLYHESVAKELKELKKKFEDQARAPAAHCAHRPPPD